MRPLLCAILVLCSVAIASAQGTRPAPQAPSSGNPPLRVFLDCDRCDDQFVKREVAFVDYVLDRTAADVHVLVTTQQTGGGGTAWTVAFLGEGRFDNQDRTLTFNTSQTATDDEQRKAFVRVMKLGLVPFVTDTVAEPQLDVTWKRPEGAGQTSADDDPWNYWVFRIGAGGNRGGEQSNNNAYYYFNASADRTTDKWKINFSGNGNRSGNSFKLDDGRKITSSSRNWNGNALVVKSLTAKWSAGARVNLWHSSFSNEDLVIRVAPAVEFNVFPYAESNRRSLTFRYAIATDYRNYDEVTIFDKREEVVPAQVFNADLGLKQPWGSLSTALEYADHLNHADRSRTRLSANADVRLFKGLSFNVFGQYVRSRDLIGLRKGEASTEDVLLRVQQLATGYSYYMNFGITYRFGSIFNNVVNTRFD